MDGRVDGVEIVNPVATAELLGWSETLQTTFLAEPDPERTQQGAQFWGERLAPERTWGARDRGRWVATLATETRQLALPGGASIPVDALTGVTVNATHRRRGLLSSMLTAALAAARERGDALAYLVAAEWPIYGRFGYAPAVRLANYTLRRGVVPGESAGVVRQVDAAEFATAGPAVFEAVWGQRAGDVSRLPRSWRYQLEEKPRGGHWRLVVHETGGVVDGIAKWRPTREFDFDEHGAIEVQDLLAASPDAYQGLWAYLAGMDVVEEVQVPYRPVDEPIRFLLHDGRALRTTSLIDFSWLALLDVPAALTARSYRTSGRLVLDVVDPSVTGYATGRWVLDATPEGTTCEPTAESPDLTLPAAALASAYLGDFPLALTGRGYGVDERSAGALAHFDLLFGTAVLPWCSTGF